MSLAPEIDVAKRATLADFTNPCLIVPELKERDTAGIISELTGALHRGGCLADVLPFYHAALNQELLTNSALDFGIALPHARSGGIRQLQFALGRMPEPFCWGPRGSQRVDLVFLMGVPATDAARYLNFLSGLARLGQQPECLASLRAAPTAEAMLSVLEQIPIRQG